MDSTPPDSPAASRPLSFLAAAAWTVIAAILLVLLIALIDSAHPGAFTDVVTVAGCKVVVYSVVLFGILRVHEPDASIRRILALRRPPALMLVFGAIAGAGLSPAAMFIQGIFAKRYPPSPEENEALEHIFTTDSVGKKVALVLALAIVIPIADEMFFRGALFTPLKKGRRAEMVILATAAYDTLLIGFSPRQVASALATTLIFAWMRATSGSVLPSVGARVAFFSVQVLPFVLNHDDDPPLRIVIVSAVAAALSLAGMAWMGRRSELARSARLLDG